MALGVIFRVREASAPLRAINRGHRKLRASLSPLNAPVCHLSRADDAPLRRNRREVSAKFPAAHCARVSKGKWRFINRIPVFFRSPLSLGESRLTSITSHYKMSAHDPRLIFDFKRISLRIFLLLTEVIFFLPLYLP